MYGAYGSTIFGPSSCTVCATGYDGQGRDEIAAIQTALGTLGYLSETEVTGQYGSKTYAAVQQFQRAYGLDVDGRVGPSTLSLLLEQSERRLTAQAALSNVEPTDTPVAPPPSYQPPTSDSGKSGLAALTSHKMFYPTLIGSVLLIGGAIYLRRRGK